MGCNDFKMHVICGLFLNSSHDLPLVIVWNISAPCPDVHLFSCTFINLISYSHAQLQTLACDMQSIEFIKKNKQTNNFNMVKDLL